MKIHTINLAFRGVAAALALTVPGISLASDHILIVKSGTPVAVTNVGGTPGTSVTTINGVVTSAGSVSTPITIAVPVAQGLNINSGNPVTYGTGQTLAVQTLPKVKMCKPGTVDKTTGEARLEWLDQGGPRVIGAIDILNSAMPVNNQNNFIYRLVLTQSVTDNIASSNGLCFDLGALSYSVTRTAEIESRNGNSDNFGTEFTGIFSFGNVLGSGTGGVPEPGTLSLIGLGLAGLGWMGARRARKARASAV